MDRAIGAADITVQLHDPIAKVSAPANLAAAIEADRQLVHREDQPVPWSVRLAGTALALLAVFLLLIALT